jgi:hypothetical protein
MSIPLDQLQLAPAQLQVFSRADNLGRKTPARTIEWARVPPGNLRLPRQPRLALRRSHLEPPPLDRR